MYRKYFLLFYLLLSSLGFAEFKDIPSYYGSKAVYKDLLGNWPAFTYRIQETEQKPTMRDLFDSNLQMFPCGPLKAWLIAFKGSRELCVYHFINNDGSNVKQTSQSSRSHKSKRGRYVAKIESGVDSLLPSSGVNRFDIIVGVNGKLFADAQPSGVEGGEYGPIYELALAIERGQAVGKITLMVKSPKDKAGTPPHLIHVRLEKLPPFAKNFPSKCRRSAMIEAEILDLFAKDSEQNPKLSNNISWGMVGLAMLASGRKKYLPAIENYAMFICSKLLQGGGANKVVTGHQGSAWKSGFQLIFLAEYFWATGDMTVFPVLQRFAYDTDEYYHNVLGAAGHNPYGHGTYFTTSFGAPNGLNALGGALAEKVGAKVNSKLYSDYWNTVTLTTLKQIKSGDSSYRFKLDPTSDYFVSYSHDLLNRPLARSTGAMQCINTSLATLALWFSRYPSKDVKGLAIKLNDNMIYNYKINTYIHTTPMIGLFFSQISLNMLNNSRVLEDKVKATFDGPYSKRYASTAGVGKFTAHDAWRRIMDYRKYLLILSRVSKDQYLYFPARKQNGGKWGGDGYANLEGSSMYSLLNIVVSNRRNLLMYGNTRRNWLVARSAKEASQLSKVTEKKIREYHNVYSNFLLKQVAFLLKGGKDHARIAAGDKKLKSYYTLLAFRVVKKILTNYRGYPAYKKAQQLGIMIMRKFGGKKSLAMHLKNLEGMQIVDYATVRQERCNRKQWMPLRKAMLKWVENNYADCPVSKRAAEEYKRTLELEKTVPEDGDDRYKIESDSEFDLKAEIPRVDIKDVE
jgi:hypothetical protein